ncbi:20738_t:CDS:2, partial [Gigaspora margarita]
TTMTEATIEDVIISVRHNVGKDSDNQSLEITELVEDQAILEKLGQILDIIKIEFLHKNFYIEKAGEINSYEAVWGNLHKTKINKIYNKTDKTEAKNNYQNTERPNAIDSGKSMQDIDQQDSLMAIDDNNSEILKENKNRQSNRRRYVVENDWADLVKIKLDILRKEEKVAIFDNKKYEYDKILKALEKEKGAEQNKVQDNEKADKRELKLKGKYNFPLDKKDKVLEFIKEIKEDFQ